MHRKLKGSTPLNHPQRRLYKMLSTGTGTLHRLMTGTTTTLGWGTPNSPHRINSLDMPWMGTIITAIVWHAMVDWTHTLRSFPIYGPVSNSELSELDSCNGRVVNGQYRYHIRNKDQVDENASYCNGTSPAIQWNYVLG